jgi:uncharacterized protein (DUF2236 family)
MPELDGIGALLAGTANVVMQLSRPGVGYGVVESRVESGQLMRHPVKRFRTTLTYLAVALLGTDREREVYRAAVNRAHASVRSGPGSPVPYDAFDRDLQKWVAACLYYGAVDVRTRLHGPMDEAEADRFYQEASRLATTLQVRPEDWPPDRAGFARYWEEALSEVAIDASVRDYLDAVIGLRFLPAPLRVLPAGLSRFLTAGFLPPLFREQMGLAWSDADQACFDRLIGAIGAVNRLLPPAARAFPLNACLWDMRLRSHLGRRLV